MTAGRSATMSVAGTGSGSRRLEQAFVDGGLGLTLARQCGVARARRSRRHAGRSRCCKVCAGSAHVVVDSRLRGSLRLCLAAVRFSGVLLDAGAGAGTLDRDVAGARSRRAPLVVESGSTLAALRQHGAAVATVAA
jgi:hypothetical protein